jgi:hypothetical protein
MDISFKVTTWASSAENELWEDHEDERYQDVVETGRV